MYFNDVAMEIFYLGEWYQFYVQDYSVNVKLQ